MCTSDQSVSCLPVHFRVSNVLVVYLHSAWGRQPCISSGQQLKKCGNYIFYTICLLLRRNRATAAAAATAAAVQQRTRYGSCRSLGATVGSAGTSLPRAVGNGRPRDDLCCQGHRNASRTSTKLPWAPGTCPLTYKRLRAVSTWQDGGSSAWLNQCSSLYAHVDCNAAHQVHTRGKHTDGISGACAQKSTTAANCRAVYRSAM